jgi:branched-chain amino acid transport system ATP-binding protein
MTGQPLLRRGVETYYGKIRAFKGSMSTSTRARSSPDRRQRRRKVDADDDHLRQPAGARPVRSPFEGRDITKMPTHEIARLRIAQSPEGRRIFPRMSVFENLQMGAAVSIT